MDARIYQATNFYVVLRKKWHSWYSIPVNNWHITAFTVTILSLNK